MRALSFVLTLTSLSALAAPPAKTKTSPKPEAAYGLWEGGCDKDPDLGEPTRDWLEFTQDKFVQYALSFDGAKDCTAMPSVITRIEYKPTRVPADKKHAEGLILKGVSAKVTALSAGGAIALSKAKACGRTTWRIGESIDCTKLPPFKVGFEQAPQGLLVRWTIEKGAFHYAEIDEDGEPVDSDPSMRLERRTEFPAAWGRYR